MFLSSWRSLQFISYPLVVDPRGIGKRADILQGQPYSAQWICWVSWSVPARSWNCGSRVGRSDWKLF